MRKQRKSVKLVAVLAGVSLIAAACGDDDEPDTTGGDTTEAVTDTTGTGGVDTTAPSTEATTPETTGGEVTTPETTGEAAPGGTVTFGTAQEFSSLNNNTADQNSVKNGQITTIVLPDALPYNGKEGGDPVLDTELMESAEIISDDPQVIEYVVKQEAVWSDGEPIDCDDFYLPWIANNETLTESGDPPPKDPVKRAETTWLFQPAGTNGYKQIESIDCSDDGKTITTNFSTPFSDWAGNFQDMVPAHVVEREAGVEDLIAAYESEDRAALEKLAAFYVNGFTPDPGTIPEDIFLSGDAFIIDSWEPAASLTLVPNPNYWGTPPNLDSLVIRQVAEEAQAQALANEEIDVMSPQPTTDLLTDVNSLDGVTVQTGSQFIWEHFDFNFREGSPFTDIKVRQAFAKCLPREQMLTNLVQPVAPDATLLGNRWIQEFEEGYADASGGEYDTVDIEGAQALLDEAGVQQPVPVRLGWNLDTGNQRRVDQVAATIQSCNQAGFEVTDAGTETFFEGDLDQGQTWDVAMFAWAGSPLKTGSIDAYCTGCGNNNGKYTNPQVDDLETQLAAELDPATVTDLANQIDAILWEDLATIPLYSHPSVDAWRDNLQNVVSNPSQNAITFNAREWAVAQ